MILRIGLQVNDSQGLSATKLTGGKVGRRLTLISKLMPKNYKARPERVLLSAVVAWDSNCPQHIPQRFEAADVAAALAERDGRIAELESEVRRLRGD